MWLLLIIIISALALVGLNIKYFLVSVPEVTGLLTVNLFTGKLKPYKTGLHFIPLWEQVKEGNFINLRVITESMEESYPSEDGPVMLVKWSFQYRPILKLLGKYISSDDHTIKEGVKDVGSSILSASIAGQLSENCKTNQHQIEEALRNKFASADPTPEELYGIELIRVSLADVDFEPTVQAVRASAQVSAKLTQMATAIRLGHPEISQKDAMNAAMIIHGKVSKNIMEVEGEGGNALAALLAGIFRGGKS